jgi:hypothetical protein
MSEQIAIADIIVPEGRRPLDQVKVEEIAASIKVVGLLSPIGIRYLDGHRIELVFGAHRLAACRMLGAEMIRAVNVGLLTIFAGADHEKLVEIAENLHRAELTTQERNEHLAQWVGLLEKRGPPISDAERPISKPGRKPSPAVDAAAKMSGLSPKTVRQAIKTTKVSPAVKAAADKAELTSKQRLAISRLPEAEQLDAVQAAISAKDKPKQPKPADRAESSDTPKFISQFTRTDGQVKAACDFNPEDPGDVAESDSDTPEIIRHRIFMYRAAEALRLAREFGLEKASMEEITDNIIEGASKAAEAWSELTSKLKPNMAAVDRAVVTNTVSVIELAVKLEPIIDGLKAMCKERMARIPVRAVARFAVLLQQLLDEWKAES